MVWRLVSERLTEIGDEMIIKKKTPLFLSRFDPNLKEEEMIERLISILESQGFNIIDKPKNSNKNRKRRKENEDSMEKN